MSLEEVLKQAQYQPFGEARFAVVGIHPLATHYFLI